jgi:hypothetical protein
MLTGAQTTKRRKAGSRVTTAGTFAGSGQALNVDTDNRGMGTGFRKKAGRCVILVGILLSLIPRNPASEPAKNGPWLRKNAWFLYKAKVNASLMCKVILLNQLNQHPRLLRKVLMMNPTTPT